MAVNADGYVLEMLMQHVDEARPDAPEVVQLAVADQCVLPVMEDAAGIEEVGCFARAGECCCHWHGSMDQARVYAKPLLLLQVPLHSIQELQDEDGGYYKVVVLLEGEAFSHQPPAATSTPGSRRHFYAGQC
jgi:hypothetical protein